MKKYSMLGLSCIAFLVGCTQQTRQQIRAADATELKVGGRCEGCEAVFESPVDFEKLDAIDTLPGFDEGGPRLEISGTIFQRDGKTPAPNVVLYVYHTDQGGNYSVRKDDPDGGAGWGSRHGSYRGWIRTGADGRYSIFTTVPASYPNSRNPQHIHPTIKEEGMTAYWIDEWVFDNDPLLPQEEKTRANPRGGSGLLKPEMKNGMLRATKDIILGLNVPGYPR